MPVPSPAPSDDEGLPFDEVAWFDPDCGPPSDEDAWLGCVASPIRDQYFDEQDAAAGAGVSDAITAGFTHRYPDGATGPGFASGGVLDSMVPGPVLAGFTDEAWAGGAGLPKLTDDELIGVLCAARRLASWSAAVELAATSDLDQRRTASAAATGDHRGVDHVPDEVAAALMLTGRAACRLVELAAGTARLPAVRVALAAGRIDLPRAGVFPDELAGLDDIHAAAVAAVVIRDAEGLTTGQLRAVLHRAVLGIDPAAARKRREKAQKDARVEMWSELAGTAALAGRDLPPAEVLAADKQLSADAAALKAAGAEGTMAFLRSRVFLARLAGLPLHTLLPAPASDAGESGSPDEGHPGDGTGDDGPGDPDGGNGDGPGGRGGPGGPGGGSGPAPGTSPGSGPFRPGGLKGSVNLTVPLATWLGLSGQPGDAAGYGPLDAATSRDLARLLSQDLATRWCLTLTDPYGHPIAHGCTTKSPGPPPDPPDPGPPDTGPPGAGSSQSPGAGPPPPGPPETPPPGSPGAGSQPAGPLGTTPPRPDPGPDRASPSNRSPGPPPASSPGPSPGAFTAAGAAGPWLAAITLDWLETGTCTHPRQTPGYTPSARLRHLIKTRDVTCTYPTCRRPATACDDDHTTPYDQGGITCECNLGPHCRHHHQAKQAPGWTLTQPTPGTFVWTLPSGRTYISRPGTYL